MSPARFRTLACAALLAVACADVGGGADTEAGGGPNSAADGASPAAQNLTCYQGNPGDIPVVMQCPFGGDVGMCARYKYACPAEDTSCTEDEKKGKETSICAYKKDDDDSDMCEYFKANSPEPSEVVCCDEDRCNGRELLVRGAPDGTVSKSVAVTGNSISPVAHPGLATGLAEIRAHDHIVDTEPVHFMQLPAKTVEL